MADQQRNDNSSEGQFPAPQELEKLGVSLKIVKQLLDKELLEYNEMKKCYDAAVKEITAGGEIDSRIKLLSASGHRNDVSNKCSCYLNSVMNVVEGMGTKCTKHMNVYSELLNIKNNKNFKNGKKVTLSIWNSKKIKFEVTTVKGKADKLRQAYKSAKLGLYNCINYFIPAIKKMEQTLKSELLYRYNRALLLVEKKAIKRICNKLKLLTEDVPSDVWNKVNCKKPLTSNLNSLQDEISQCEKITEVENQLSSVKSSLSVLDDDLLLIEKEVVEIVRNQFILFIEKAPSEILNNLKGAISKPVVRKSGILQDEIFKYKRLTTVKEYLSKSGITISELWRFDLK